MTRGKRIQKLANAIKRFRGKYHPETKKWIETPDPSAEMDCVRWMVSLGVQDLDAGIKTICEFKSFPEFRRWMQATFPN